MKCGIFRDFEYGIYSLRLFIQNSLQNSIFGNFLSLSFLIEWPISSSNMFFNAKFLYHFFFCINNWRHKNHIQRHFFPTRLSMNRCNSGPRLTILIKKCLYSNKVPMKKTGRFFCLLIYRMIKKKNKKMLKMMKNWISVVLLKLKKIIRVKYFEIGRLERENFAIEKKLFL